MRRLIIALAASAALALGLSGCEVYSPSSGKSPSAWASEHFARAGKEFVQAGQAIAQVVDQATPALADAAAAYYAGRANSYAAPPRYEAPKLTNGTLIGPGGTTFINGTSHSGTIIGPPGTSFYNLDSHGSGMILGPNGTTFINGY
jgi:hypothetical protein